MGTTVKRVSRECLQGIKKSEVEKQSQLLMAESYIYLLSVLPCQQLMHNSLLCNGYEEIVTTGILYHILLAISPTSTTKSVVVRTIEMTEKAEYITYGKELPNRATAENE